MLTWVIREIELAGGVKIVHSPPKKGISWSVSHNKREFSTDTDKNPSADSAPAAFPGQVKLNIEHISKTKSTVTCSAAQRQNLPIHKENGNGMRGRGDLPPSFMESHAFFCPWMIRGQNNATGSDLDHLFLYFVLFFRSTWQAIIPFISQWSYNQPDWLICALIT